ncbi:MAG: HepT-like ribonuclease domain-containing protein [Candidatus Helarchaeota archaeon]
MPRAYKTYLKDILEAIRKIKKYTNNISYDKFADNELIQDAVTRNLEIIGEAIKFLPENVKRSNPDVEWRKIAGLRDILIHAYFGIDVEIIWDIVENKLLELKEKILSN